MALTIEWHDDRDIDGCERALIYGLGLYEVEPSVIIDVSDGRWELGTFGRHHIASGTCVSRDDAARQGLLALANMLRAKVDVIEYVKGLDADLPPGLDGTTKAPPPEGDGAE